MPPDKQIAEMVEKMRALLSAATDGPWYAADWTEDDGPNLTTIEAHEPEGPLGEGCSSLWPDGIRKICVAETYEGNRPLEDAAFIAAAKTELPALLDALEAMRAEREALRKEVRMAAERLSAEGQLKSEGHKEGALRAKMDSIARDLFRALANTEGKEK